MDDTHTYVGKVIQHVDKRNNHITKTKIKLIIIALQLLKYKLDLVT